MNQQSDQDYYVARAATSRDLAKRAADPASAAIHAELAIRYDKLAVRPERQDGGRMTTIQAI